MKANLGEMLVLLENTTRTPAGLVVSGHSVDTLVKAEARRLEEEQSKARFFSQFAFQNMAAWGAREKPQGTPSFTLLRQAAEKSFIDRIIIRNRINKQKTIWQRHIGGKKMGFQVVHDLHDDPDFKITPDIKRRCEEMEKLLADPTPSQFAPIFPHRVRVHRSIKDLIACLEQASLIIDRKVIQRYKARDGEGYAAFHWLPGDTIKNVDESVRDWAAKHEKDGKESRYTREKMSYGTGWDIEKAAYVQVVDGMVTAAFTDSEISVYISNPSDEVNRWGYGTSDLEISLDITAALLHAWNYNRELFNQNYPESILKVSGGFSKEGLLAFKQQLYTDAGRGANKRLPVVDGTDEFKVENVKIRDTPKDMMFPELFRMMVMLKAAAYGTHPSTINFSMSTGSSIFGHSEAQEIDLSQEQWLIPTTMDYCDWFTQDIIKPRYDDLQLIVTGLKKEDEKAAIEVLTARTKNHITRNEARVADGQEPIGDLKDENNPWNFPADAPMSSYIATINGLQAQEEVQQEEQKNQDKDPVEKSEKYLELFIK